MSINNFYSRNVPREILGRLIQRRAAFYKSNYKLDLRKRDCSWQRELNACSYRFAAAQNKRDFDNMWNNPKALNNGQFQGLTLDGRRRNVAHGPDWRP